MLEATGSDPPGPDPSARLFNGLLSQRSSASRAARAIIAATRSGAATASLPAALARASRDRALAGLARRRVVIDRDRHRERNTQARLSFPHAGPRLPTRTAPAQISICRPLAA